MAVNAPLNRKLRMGLVGGGQGAFIGRVHATAAILDNRAALVAGALSSDAAKAQASAPDYDIKPERAYSSYKEIAIGATCGLAFPATRLATPEPRRSSCRRPMVEASSISRSRPSAASGMWPRSLAAGRCIRGAMSTAISPAMLGG